MKTPTSRGAFAEELATHNSDDRDRRWLFVPYDQLSSKIGPLSREKPETLGIVLIEAPAKAARRPYHKQKLALVLTNLRHFAIEQARRGVAVRHVIADGNYGDALKQQIGVLGPMRVMRPAERELRAELAPLVRAGDLEVLEHEGWLTTTEQFAAAHSKGPPWRMDQFYRRVRRDSGLLMDDDGKPTGGKFSFDTDNRKRWPGTPAAPDVPKFRSDAITDEVVQLVATEFAEHPGTLDPSALPATARQAASLWRWAQQECMASFGPYQDAMSQHSASLFHSRISALLHLHRLLPREVVDDVLELPIGLESREGFLRQVIGWREYVRHVHEATDGFRQMPCGDRPRAAPSALGADRPLPPAYWGEVASGLHCLDRVVADVWREGYGHHITRLMVLSNLATLLDVSPRALTDWFWVAYTDAYDWVVEPNVLGMGTYGAGDLMTTKPYIAGSAYIDRMSDFCGDCAFNPKTDCPFRSLYWAFLDRHSDALATNRRMSIPLASARKRDGDKKLADRKVFESVSKALTAGETLAP